MIDHINLRCTLYPLLRMENGYFSSNKCCSCTATESVERTGCTPDDGTQDNGLNKNQEGNDLNIGKLQANSENVQGAAPVAPKNVMQQEVIMPLEVFAVKEEWERFEKSIAQHDKGEYSPCLYGREEVPPDEEGDYVKLKIVREE